MIDWTSKTGGYTCYVMKGDSDETANGESSSSMKGNMTNHDDHKDPVFRIRFVRFIWF